MDPLSQLSKQHNGKNKNSKNNNLDENLLNELDDLDNKVLISQSSPKLGGGTKGARQHSKSNLLPQNKQQTKRTSFACFSQNKIFDLKVQTKIVRLSRRS